MIAYDQEPNETKSKPTTQHKPRTLRLTICPLPVDGYAEYDMLDAISALGDGDYDGTLTTHNAPEFLIVCASLVQRAAMQEAADGERIKKITLGCVLSAAGDFGLTELYKHSEIQVFIAEMERVESLKDLSFQNIMAWNSVTKAYAHQVDDLKWGHKKAWGVRAHSYVRQRFYEASRVLHVSLSDVVLRCIMRGLANQPGCQNKMSECMLEQFQSFVADFPQRTLMSLRISEIDLEE